MNPKRWKWYTWVTTIYFILSLWAMHRIAGRIDGLAGVLEVAILPGLIWLFFFTLYKAADFADRRAKPAKPPQN